MNFSHLGHQVDVSCGPPEGIRRPKTLGHNSTRYHHGHSPFLRHTGAGRAGSPPAGKLAATWTKIPSPAVTGAPTPSSSPFSPPFLWSEGRRRGWAAATPERAACQTRCFLSVYSSDTLPIEREQKVSRRSAPVRKPRYSLSDLYLSPHPLLRSRLVRLGLLVRRLSPRPDTHVGHLANTAH